MPYLTQIVAAVSMCSLTSQVKRMTLATVPNNLLKCTVTTRSHVDMDAAQANQVVELRLTYRYIKDHPWTVQAINGFLSAYFMEKPDFAVQRHYDDLESGMHVWICDIPANMKITALLRRLQADIPPCRHFQPPVEPPARPQYVIDSPE